MKTKFKSFRNIHTVLVALSLVLWINGTIRALASWPQQPVGNEVWISPVGMDGTGTGTAADPYVVTTAASFDALIGCVNEYGRTGSLTPLVSPIPTNSTIHLMGGTFFTYGQIRPKTNWKIRGAGIDVTIVQQQPWNTYPMSAYIATFGFGDWDPGQNDGIEISDMTVDCNLQANTSAGASFDAFWLCAGNNMRISRVKAINWGETGTCGTECVVFGIYGGGANVITNCVIEDCELGNPAPVPFSNGANGFGIMGAIGEYSDAFGPGWIQNAEIRNCVISGITIDTTGTNNIGRPLGFFHGIGGGNVDG